MNFHIDWLAFVQVFVAAMISAVVVVSFYSLGLRLLVRAGRPPVVAPAEFTDAITIVTEKDRARAEKAALKAARKNPLTDGQKRVALAGPTRPSGWLRWRCSAASCSSSSTTDEACRARPGITHAVCAGSFVRYEGDGVEDRAGLLRHRLIDVVPLADRHDRAVAVQVEDPVRLPLVH